MPESNMFIVVFLNTDEIDFMPVTFGPYPTQEQAEEARLAFIRDMDDIDEFSAVWAGAVLPVVPYAEAARRMGNTLRDQLDD